MANLTSVARPYARAAFEYANGQQQLLAWKMLLETASEIVKQPEMAKLLINPKVAKDKLLELFCGILSALMNANEMGLAKNQQQQRERLSDEEYNFIHLLVQNERLIAMPDIAKLFDVYFGAMEKTSVVRVITAIDMEESLRKKLKETLMNRMQHKVILECEIDPAILGGAIIHMGDRVIDGSVRGKLMRLLEFSLR
ncbi:MAG TPA: F0F1 ATP synthase subunit delta [Gammaproteobacteria bacterium]|jgi:F-type H+-transporting ATPase subunit delta|nr:F0F1 ATP synthase subunit delta [Gammaproteobacteria bacterium]